MFSRRVNTVIKTVNYFTLTLSRLSKLSLPCLITQYFAIDEQLKLITHLLTLLIHVYYNDTCEIPALPSARLKQRGCICSVVLTR